jgi:AcrR family transcriptional regulator
MPPSTSKGKKRTAGTRAGMTRARILSAASNLWQSAGQDNFSVLSLGKRLGVVPATIKAHFHGGGLEIQNELASIGLLQLAPPYGPAEDPKEYLRKVFHSALLTFRSNKNLGRLIAIRLAEDPFLNPLFAERICRMLTSVAKKHDPARAFHKFLVRFVGLAIVETSSWSFTRPETGKARIRHLSAFGEAEFPTLQDIGEAAVAELSIRNQADYIQKAAQAACDALLLELAKGSP